MVNTCFETTDYANPPINPINLVTWYFSKKVQGNIVIDRTDTAPRTIFTS